MVKQNRIGVEKYIYGGCDMQSYEDIRDNLIDLCDVINKVSNVITISPNYINDIMDHYIEICALFSRDNKLENEYVINKLSVVLPKYDINSIRLKFANYYKASNQINEVITNYVGTYLINQVVKMDKLVNNSLNEGITMIYFYNIRDMLQNISDNFDIDTKNNNAFNSCINALRKIIDEKWNETNMMFFSK